MLLGAEEYGFATARTTHGAIGVKCWIFHGEILPTTRGGVRPQPPSSLA